MNGFFITFEGIDGSGKTTVATALHDMLSSSFALKQVILTREPGGTRFGQRIREIVLNEQCIDVARLFLMLADRTQHCVEILKPYLEKGHVVISDRYTDSTIVYQSNIGLTPTVINALNEISKHGIVPNLTFLLDVEQHIAIERIRKSLKTFDVFEDQQINVYMHRRSHYLHLATIEPERIKVIDTHRPLSVIIHEVFNITVEHLRKKEIIKDE